MSVQRTLEETRGKILETAKEFESFVCATMGPFGQNIALHSSEGTPVITKDGVSVAKVIEFDDPGKNLVAEILKQAAEKTNSEAGDGTTTSTAIAYAMIKEGNKLISGGYDVNFIRREVDKYLEDIKNSLNEMKVEFGNKDEEEIQDILFKIAMISTNGDEKISKLISEATAKAGKSGLVNTSISGSKYGIKQTNGIKIPNAGVVNYEFIKGCPDKKNLLKKCRILFTTYDLESATIISELEQKVLKPIMERGETLLILTKKSDKGFLANMIANNAKGVLRNAIIKAPYFGAVGREMMDDLAAFTGGIVIDEKLGMEFKDVELEDLGFALEAEVSPWYTVLYQPQTDALRLEKRIEILKEKAKAIGYKENDSDKTMERLAALTGKIYTIQIPSSSDIEDKEKMDRVDDATNACRGALDSGFLPGGGVALLKASEKVSSFDSPVSLMLTNVITYPFRRILTNASEKIDVIENVISNSESPIAYDARTKVYGNPLELGVIDSFKVVERSLSNGISVGLMLLTTTGLLAKVKKEETGLTDFYNY